MIKLRYAGALLLMMIGILLLAPAVNAATGSVDVVEVGMLSHGPMQPTIRAVDEVIGKYGDQIHVTKYDLTAPEGAQYAKDHGIVQHFSLFMNGNNHYTVNGKDVTFEMFEGQEWTKEDLDAVIASELGLAGGNVSRVSSPAQGNTKPAPLELSTVVLALGIIVVAGFACNRRKE